MSVLARGLLPSCGVLVAMASAAQRAAPVPVIWDDRSLDDWATPLASLKIRPAHYTATEFYAIPGDNLRTYPVYRPDKEPPGYWEELQKKKPEPLVDVSTIRSQRDWIEAGARAFREGTGFYKIPSLRGLWYRPRLLHDASIVSLEELFDAARLDPAYERKGWSPPGTTKGVVSGLEFLTTLSAEDKKALIAFLRSL